MHTIIPKLASGAAAPPAGPVDFVGTGTTNVKTTSGTTQSFSHNRTAATKGALVVKSMNENPVSTITYDGDSMTKIREEGFGVAGSSFWMINDAASTGSNTVLITFSVSTSDAVARCDNLENVDQTTMSDADNGQNGNLASSSLSVTIAVDGLAMDCVAEDFFPISSTGGGSQITLNNTTDGTTETASAYNNVQTAGSKTLGWTWSFSNNCGHVIVSVKNG